MDSVDLSRLVAPTRSFILEILILGSFLSKYSYNTQDGLYDVAWSEIHENQLVSASGDGSLKLWDITINVGLDT